VKKLEIILDEYLLEKNEQEDLIKLFKNFNKIKSDIIVGDTHAKGGITWFPTDLIIVAFGMTASGFFAALGEDLYKKLKDKLIKIIKKEKPHNKKIEQFYFAFEIDNIRFYFEIYDFFSNNIGDQIDRIAVDFPNIVKEAKIIKKIGLRTIGEFESITYRFDEDCNHWVVAHFNKYKS